MSRPLRVAGIGAGYFSQFHYDGWHRHKSVTLVGICDHDTERAARLAADYGAPAVFGDAAAMLDAVAPDLVDIITPPESHAALVALARSRNIAAVCQKPLAPDFETARAMAEQSASGPLLVVHENFRFSPWYREAKRLIDGGGLGAPYGIAFRLRPGDGQGPQAYLHRQPYFQDMPRFLIHETAIHFVDVFRYLMGEVSGLVARLRRLNPAIAGEDAGIVLFEFANGAQGLFDGNRLSDFVAEDPRLTMGDMLMDGAAARLRLDGDGGLWLKPHGGAEAPHAYAWTARGFAGDCVFRLQDHVIAHLLEGAPLENRAADYIRNLEIEEAIYRSAEEGRWVNLL